ncbi:CoA transferase [Rhodococcus sp. IEGM 1366]|uniref:CoA transferase n=1 Tax=Rhodococcus sp. IEGM 1366 TaxID=3082223 RepID=UPI002953575D|nr:CoA transferase [Rhodococcus sp. IEGM 1366]MDV8071381.1 CoA transferase [Rhodococcus sp. IEGM 1366]
MFAWRDTTDETERIRNWLGSGIATLTGSADGPPLIPPGRAATIANRLGSFIGTADDGARFLSERAAFTGMTRNGNVSVGGKTRLLPTSDGWAAVSCARESDPSLLSALISHDIADNPWLAVTAWLSAHPGAELAERAMLLGLAAAPVQRSATPAPTPTTRRCVDGMLVVDFSALWAGPLCAHLVGAAGARVVKVEIPTRADGARLGNPEFYSLLHAGHESVVLDPSTAAGRSAMAQLVDRADIVIEASRPRALAGFGLDADAAVSSGTTWISITAAGRESPRIGFGDDIAASSGLIAHDVDGSAVFVGDAIADPLTGLLAAALAMSETPSGAGHLWDISMADLVSSTLPLPLHADTPECGPQTVSHPRKRASVGIAPPSGADTESVLRSLGIEVP